MRRVLIIGLIVGLGWGAGVVAGEPEAEADDGAGWRGSGNMPQVRLAKYKDDKAAAVSLTFDDGFDNAATIAAPLLEKHGLRGTFYIVTDWVRETEDSPIKPGNRDKHVSWDVLKTMQANGHEIGNHSASHPFLHKIEDEEKLEREIVGSLKLLDKKLGAAPRSFAYPFAKYNDAVKQKVLAHHPADRAYSLLYGKGFTAEKANKLIDKAIKEKGWHVAIAHGVGEPHGFQPIDAAELDDHLAYVKARGKDLWVAPFVEVARYERTRKAARIEVAMQVLGHTRGRVMWTLSFNEAFDAERVAAPLTFVVDPKLPAKNIKVMWLHDDVRKKLDFTTTDGGHIRVTAPPRAGGEPVAVLVSFDVDQAARRKAEPGEQPAAPAE